MAADWQLRMMLPTARHARGRPATVAMSPYVAAWPGGMRRTALSTRAVKSDAVTGWTLARRPSESSQDGLPTRHAVSAEAGFAKTPG
jgi:hypothetical protein